MPAASSHQADFAGVALWDDGAKASVTALRSRTDLGSDCQRLLSTDSFAVCIGEDVTASSHDTGTGYRHAEGRLCVFSGRIDNEDDLTREAADRRWAAQSPANLVLSRYLREEVDWAKSLIGDYCFAIWDSIHRVIVLGRDPFGVRTLFYRHTKKGVEWSTGLGRLVERADLSRLDELYLAEYLTGTETGTRTPYSTISAVGPGEVVVFSQRATARRVFYEVSPQEPGVISFDDAQEQLKAVFFESVAKRLDSTSPVIAELSGGLDSSSIVCVAAQLIAAGQVRTPALHPVTYVYDGSQTADERAFVRAAEGVSGLRSTVIGGPILEDYDGDGITGDTPNPMLLFSELRQMPALMNQIGARRLLSGIGGDNLLASGDLFCPLIADLLRKGRVGAAVRLGRISAKTERNSLLSVLWRSGVWPTLPLGLRSRWAPRVLRLPEWIPNRMMRLHSLRAVSMRLRQPDSAFTVATRRC